MTRRTRKSIPSDIVHVTVRGLGRRIIFEDDADKRKFLDVFKSKLDGADITVYAWCLMDNHAHLLLRAQNDALSKAMQRTLVSYAQYFNGRHGHVGKVFQNRFSAQAVESEVHFLAAIRYIHRNAHEAGASNLCDYAWSSYRELARANKPYEGSGIVNCPAVLDFFSGVKEFVNFHKQTDELDDFVRIDGYRPRIDDAQAMEIAVCMLGTSFADRIRTMPKDERNTALAKLKSQGLSIRQIERLTGIGRSIISRA